MPPFFISHTSADDPFVAELRQELEALQIPVWVDSRNLRGGNKLAPEIEKAIEEASHFLAVLSPSTVNSPWVRREIKKALEVEQRRQAGGYRVIPLLLPGLTTGALGAWFDEEPVAVPIEIGPDGLSEALPEIYAALGEALPDDRQPAGQPDARPLEELLLTLTDPRIETAEGKRRAAAMATLEYIPADPGARLQKPALPLHGAPRPDRNHRPAVVSGELLPLAGGRVQGPCGRHRAEAAGMGTGPVPGRAGRRIRPRRPVRLAKGRSRSRETLFGAGGMRPARRRIR